MPFPPPPLLVLLPVAPAVPFAPLPLAAERFSELRLDAVPEDGAGPASDSSSSSSSERSSRCPPSACSLAASRAALTECCAALLFDFRM